MGRISDILTLVRDTLADPQKKRWSDARLLRLLDQGHKDIAIKTRALRAKINIALEEGVSEYTLPSDCHLISRVTFAGDNIKLKTHELMDQYSASWYDDTGSQILYAIFDKQNRQRLKVYPIPESLQSEYAYTIANSGTTVSALDNSLVAAYNILTAAGMTLDITEVTALVVDDENYGVVTGITDFTLDSVFGVVGDVTDSEDILGAISSPYGVVTDISDTLGYITVYYIRKPEAIVAEEDELATDEAFDLALKYFITGHCLRDDIDTQSRELGREELMLYDREFAEAKRVDMTDSTRGGQHETPYFNGF